MADEQVSKITGYVVRGVDGELHVPKLVGYVVRGVPGILQVPKITSYVACGPKANTEAVVSKIVAYIVIGTNNVSTQGSIF